MGIKLSSLKEDVMVEEAAAVSKKREPSNFGVLIEIEAELTAGVKDRVLRLLEDGMASTAEAKSWIRKNVDGFQTGTRLRIANLQPPVEIKAVEVKKAIL